MSKVIHNITSTCDTCTRLKILPRQLQESTTTKNTTFGSNFSADVLVEKGQHILLCREKLSQFTLTYLLEDETKQSIEEALLSLLVDLIPDDGALIQVDPGPSLTALADDSNNILGKFNIHLAIGSVHNKNKNPVAENAIKEFRKEWLRMKPNGSPLSEAERAQITAFMNKRLRTNGLAPKEIMLKRRLKDHAALEIDDMSEGQAQFDRREKANAQQKVKDSLISIYPENPKLSVADLVYIKSDLSKSRARERYIVTTKTITNGFWLASSIKD